MCLYMKKMFFKMREITDFSAPVNLQHADRLVVVLQVLGQGSISARGWGVRYWTSRLKSLGIQYRT